RRRIPHAGASHTQAHPTRMCGLATGTDLRAGPTIPFIAVGMPGRRIPHAGASHTQARPRHQDRPAGCP
ncbi:MAG: hypothetical protein NWR72_17930, partial [Bacteroidia bacterium]|nr:hypothetical protein [Bacteroidia bacterium]